MKKEEKEKILVNMFIKQLESIEKTQTKYYLFASGSLLGLLIKVQNNLISVIIIAIALVYVFYFNWNTSKIISDAYKEFKEAIKNDSIIDYKPTKLSFWQVIGFYKSRYTKE